MKVYKYRCTKNLERDLNTFSNNSFFAPKLETFPDDLEGNFNDNISAVIKQISKTFSINTDILLNLDELKNHKNKIGVYCVTRKFDSEYMWENYANSHNGYCIEYDLEKIAYKTLKKDFSNSLEVSYDNKTPTLEIHDIGKSNVIHKMFGTKQISFVEEDEIRLIFDSDSLKYHDEKAITAIYFGQNADEVLREKIMSRFTNRNILFYEIIKSENLLTRNLLAEFKKEKQFELTRYNYKVLKYSNNGPSESYHIHFMDKSSKELLVEFCLAFKEEYCFKSSNLYLYSTPDMTNSLIADADFSNIYDSNVDFSVKDFLYEY